MRRVLPYEMFDFSSGLRYTALSADGEFSEAAPESGRKVHDDSNGDDYDSAKRYKVVMNQMK